MSTKQHSSQRILTTANVLTLAVIILFSCSNRTFAQQWSTSGNDISNSNSGNVGVGTTSPGVKLDILSSVSLIARFGSSAGGNTEVLIDAQSAFNSNLTLQRGGASKWLMGNRASNDRLSFVGSSGSEVLTLLQNGNMGIGASNPQDSFHLLTTNGIATMRLQSGASKAAFIAFWDLGQMLMLTNNRQPTGNNINSSLSGAQLSLLGSDTVFYASSSGTVGNATELMRIRGNGLVGIGTATPGYRLDVQGGTINSSGGLCIGGDCKTNWSQVGGAVSSVFGRTGAVVAATNDYTWAQINKSTSSLADIQTRNAGDLNAGTVPLARLGVSGTADVSTFLRGDNTWAAVPSSQWTSGTGNISYNSGNVGIGTATPGYLLDVSGGLSNPFRVRDSSGREYLSTTTRTGPFATAAVVSIAGSRLIIDSSGPDGNNDTIVRRVVNSLVFKPSDHPIFPGAFIVQQADGSHILHVNQHANSNVGIGTNVPAFKLDVNGEINATGLRINGTPISTGPSGPITWAQVDKSTSSLADITTRNAGDLNAGTVPLARLGVSGIADASTFLRGDNTWAAVPSSQWTSGTGNISYSGNVGIGTMSPQRTLDLGISGQLTFGNNGHTSTGSPGFFWFQDNTNYGIYKSAGAWSAPNYQQLTLAWATGVVIDGGSQHGRSGTVLQPSGGNVGIGTTAPAYKLDVAGVINSSTGGFRFPDGTVQLTAASSGGSGTVASVFGRTGAVVAAPNDYTWMQIDKTTSSLADITTRNAGDLNAGTVPLARLGVSGNADVSTFLRGDNTWAAVPSSQWTSGTNTISYNAGNVGIGTTNPGDKLEVVGNLNVTGTGNITASGTIEGGNIKAKYQDVAEWVESSEKLPTGTLVVLDHTKSNQVIASSQAYDTRVAGVISERPGIALGEAGDNKVLVATTGRVRLMVDASKSPIQIGDLLVTSEIPGVAMRSEAMNVGSVQIHRPGTLVGKALEALAKGQGKILVLLSLQ